MLASCGRTNADELLQSKNKPTGMWIERTVIAVTFQALIVILVWTC